MGSNIREVKPEFAEKLKKTEKGRFISFKSVEDMCNAFN